MRPGSPAVRRAALALLLILLTALLPVTLPAAPVAAADPGDGMPRADQDVETRRGNRTVRMRPVRTVTTADGRTAVADRLIVGFKPGVGPAERAAVHQGAAGVGAARARSVKEIGRDAQVVDVSGAPTLDQAARHYAADPRVDYAEPDYQVRASITPNDPLFGQQWGMNRIGAPLAWNVTQGAPSRVIAVLDCGIHEAGASLPNGRPGHPDLNGKVLAHRDFTTSYYGPDDYCNHGTHVAGIAAAATNNSLGVAGVGFNTRLLNAKVLDDDGSGFTSWVASGIYWATDSGAHVINMSLGGLGACSSTFQNAVNYAFVRNVVVVAAAGNNNSSALHSPASCGNTLAVGSTNSNDTRSFFSNYSPAWVDVAAPGFQILSTCPPDADNGNGTLCSGYVSFSGTSMAAPHAAGLAALVWATNHFTTAQQVVDRITGTADPVGAGVYWRHGRINAASAVGNLPAAVPADGGHNVVGATAPRMTWLFAEGYTAPGFDEYLTILNPNPTDAPVTITFFLADGSTQTRSLTVGPTARATVAVHDAGQGVGRNKEVAARVDTTNPDGIVVERPMYFRYTGSMGAVTGGHAALGGAAPKPIWYFAEGYTGPGFDQYLTILNPNPTAAEVTITFFLNGGAPVVRSLSVPASSRATVAVHDPVQGVGRNQEVAARVTTTNAGGIVVERPMYFTYGAGVAGGHDVLGANDLNTSWYFAEGYTGPGFDQYLTILNPNPTAAEVTITYYLGGGQVPVVKTLTVPASSRATVVVHDPVQGVGRDKEVAARVETTNGVGIVVERPIYFKYGVGGAIDGGHDALGANALSQRWYFAEGYTGAGFDQYLTILNPNPTAAEVTITYYLGGGLAPVVRSLTVAPNSRATVVVHDATQVGRNKEVAARVETTLAAGIIVERPIYFTYTLL